MESKSSKSLRHQNAVQEYLKFQSSQKKQELLDKISKETNSLVPRPGEFLVCSNTSLQSSSSMSLKDFNKTGLLRPNSSSIIRQSFYTESTQSRPSTGAILTTQLRNIRKPQIPSTLTLSSLAMLSDESHEIKIRPSSGITKTID